MSFPVKSFATRAIHSGQDPSKWTHRALITPISLSTTFEHFSPGEHTGYEYSRCGNPTRQCLEESIASLESAKYGLTFSSGMATVTVISHLLRSGDHVICFDDIYSGSNAHFRTLADRMGVEVTFLDLRDPSAIINAMKDNTKMVWMESPTNPTLKLVDIEAVTNILKDFPGVISVVDNTFMTPYFQNPLKLGADIVMHSLSKYINGHTDVIMGALATNSDELYNKLMTLQYSLGCVPSPFDCFLVNRGLKTLHLRMQRHMENALKIAQFLEDHPSVEKVIYPGLESHPQHKLAKKQASGFSGMISFYLKGNESNARKFTKALKVVTLAKSLGSIESLVELSSVMSHSEISKEEKMALGITDNFLRLSVGLESAADLLKDLDEALEKAFLKSNDDTHSTK